MRDFIVVLYFIVATLVILIPVGQIIASSILIFTSKNPKKRRRLGYYLKGVALFFTLLYPVYILSEQYNRDLLGNYITFGALSLTIYNVVVLSMDRQDPNH